MQVDETEAPVAVENVPAAQFVHVVAVPGATAYVPAGQLIQPLAFATE